MEPSAEPQPSHEPPETRPRILVLPISLPRTDTRMSFEQCVDIDRSKWALHSPDVVEPAHIQSIPIIMKEEAAPSFSESQVSEPQVLPKSEIQQKPTKGKMPTRTKFPLLGLIDSKRSTNGLSSIFWKKYHKLHKAWCPPVPVLNSFAAGGSRPRYTLELAQDEWEESELPDTRCLNLTRPRHLYVYTTAITFGSPKDPYEKKVDLLIDTATSASWTYALRFRKLPPPMNWPPENDPEIRIGPFTEDERYRQPPRRYGVNDRYTPETVLDCESVVRNKIIKYQDLTCVAGYDIDDFTATFWGAGSDEPDEGPFGVEGLHFLIAYATDLRLAERHYDGVLGLSPLRSADERAAAPGAYPILSLLEEKRIIKEKLFYLWFSLRDDEYDDNCCSSQLFIGGFPSRYQGTIGDRSPWIPTLKRPHPNLWTIRLYEIILFYEDPEIPPVRVSVEKPQGILIIDSGTSTSHFLTDLFAPIRQEMPCLQENDGKIYCDRTKLKTGAASIGLRFVEASTEPTVVLTADQLINQDDVRSDAKDVRPFNIQDAGSTKNYNILGVRCMRGLCMGFKRAGGMGLVQMARIVSHEVKDPN